MSDFNGYRFEGFSLDLDRAQLLADNRQIELRPQSFDVLRVLVENAGRLVTRDELHEAVWGNIAVTDDSIAHCISDIRKALGDSDKKMLRTVPRRGYLFATAVTQVRAGAVVTGAPDRRQRRVVYVAGALAVAALAIFLVFREPAPDLPVAPPNSIAVLPFVDLAPNLVGANDALPGTSLSDVLRDQLGRVSGLRLAARSSSVTVQNRELDAVSAAALLGVAHIVEGSYMQDGRDLRISVQLLDGRTGLSIWAETYERRTTELITLQNTITEAIVSRVLPGAQSDAVAATRIASANDLLLLAGNLEQKVRDNPAVDVAMLLEAVEMYREATRIDPDSAIAHSRLAGALLYLGDVGGAEAPIFRALTLDPNLSEVQLTAGEYYWARRIPGFGAAWEKAVELNPNNPDALARYAFWHWLQGKNVGPAENYRKALGFDRLSLERYWELGNFLGTQGRADEVRAFIDEVKSVFPDDSALELIARLHEFLGEVDHAIAWTLRARNLDPDNRAHNWRLAELYAVIGDYQTAQTLDSDGVGTLFMMRRYDELIEVGEELLFDEPGDIMARYLLAFAYNATGNYEGAERILRLSGFPQVMDGWPQAIDIEAGITYVNALLALGRVEEARRLADLFLGRSQRIQHTDWWVHVYDSCLFAVIENDASALAELEAVYGSARIPWYPVIMDSVCFERLSGNSRFVAVLEHIEARRAELRRRLPKTLDDYGVEL